jgi:hypothetical protein
MARTTLPGQGACGQLKKGSEIKKGIKEREGSEGRSEMRKRGSEGMERMMGVKRERDLRLVNRFCTFFIS